MIAGTAFGEESPVRMVSEWFYAEVLLEPGASAPLDADHEERAIYVTDGEVEIAGDRFEGPRLLVFRPGDRITVTATRPARLMFLGGAASKGHAICGGISFPRARSGSKRRRKSGKAAASR